MTDDAVAEFNRLANELEEKAEERIALWDQLKEEHYLGAFRNLVLSEAYEECAALLRARALELAVSGRETEKTTSR